MSNSIPQPVDLNRLKGILNGAKTIMNKVENNNFSTGNIDPRALTEDGVKQLQSEGVVRPEMSSHSQAGSYTREQVMASNLPPAIKQAMIDKPIQQLGGPSPSFSLNDVSDLVDKPIPIQKRGIPQVRNINENYSNNNSDIITINRGELNNIINEQLLKFLTQSYNKTIAEDAIKRTISTLISEGKINVKKKI